MDTLNCDREQARKIMNGEMDEEERDFYIEGEEDLSMEEL